MTSISEALKTAFQYHQANHLTQAEQIYQQILETNPKQPDALYGLGSLALQQGNLDKAEKFFQAAIKAQPNSFKHWLALGNTYQSQAEYSQAVDAYKKALAVDFKVAPIHNNLGYALEKLGQLTEAIASYKKALEIQPDCTEAYVNLGNALHTQGTLPEDKKPHYAQLNHKLGTARKRAGDLNNAINYYQQAIVLQPNNWEPHYNLGIVLQEQEKFTDAIASYEQALQNNSKHWDIYNRLGQIYQVQHELTKALSIYRQGLTLLNPNYAQKIATNQSCTIQTTPSVPQGTVKIGAHQFPSIPPVREPEKARPFWTVAMPVYKRTDYILESLANVLLQWSGETDMEIIIIDNSSTSPVYEWVNSLGGGIVNYYRNPENIGATKNMNMGISLSRGEWVHVLHDDDSVCPGFYSRLQESLKDCADNIGAACSGFEYFNKHSITVTPGEINSVYGKNRGILKDYLSRIGVCGLVMTPALVIRRTTHERLGAYSCEIPNINDWELHKRIAAFYDWWYEPEVLARFRTHSESETSDSWNSGKMAVQVGQAIEISQSYLPVASRTEITAKARIQNFKYCLAHALVPLKNNNLQGSLDIIESALLIDNSPQSVTKFFKLLNQNDASPLREAIADKLINLNI